MLKLDSSRGAEGESSISRKNSIIGISHIDLDTWNVIEGIWQGTICRPAWPKGFPMETSRLCPSGKPKVRRIQSTLQLRDVRTFPGQPFLRRPSAPFSLVARCLPRVVKIITQNFPWCGRASNYAAKSFNRLYLITVTHWLASRESRGERWRTRAKGWRQGCTLSGSR